MTWRDVFDLLLVWVIVYRVLLLSKRSGAVQILSGLGILAIAFLLSIQTELVTFHWVLEKFFSNLFLIVVILFQGEIRRFLALLGSNPLMFKDVARETSQNIEELAKGVIQLAQKGYGALIVIEKEMALDYFIEEGTVIDAAITAKILTSIFHPSSPLHDGAVLIRDGRIYSAGNFLPLSKNPILDKNLGTRHRAAIGLTEESDAVVIVVSEENRSVGLVQGGKLTANLDQATLRECLYNLSGLKVKFQGAEA
ncbi:MAG: TIGR00159 family protein [Bdellovibrio sp.]|nr:MAG: TIGR00159 family protein [Bdellovibrio sp.]